MDPVTWSWLLFGITYYAAMTITDAVADAIRSGAKKDPEKDGEKPKEGA